jgi:hypothetical protein
MLHMACRGLHYATANDTGSESLLELLEDDTNTNHSDCNTHSFLTLTGTGPTSTFISKASVHVHVSVNEHAHVDDGTVSVTSEASS